MTPERWAQIEDLFHRACECERENRETLLNEACQADPDLRRQVESLLAGAEKGRDRVRAAIHEQLETVSFPLAGESVSHYRILEGLAGGGMGLVYRAEDLKLGRQVALKFLSEESAAEPAALARFEREARAASALEHPNICPIYEFGEHQGRPFLVMQLLEGETLRELLESRKAERQDPQPTRAVFPISEVLSLSIQIANGLEAAHQKGIIHRDIKPANIFVTKDGQAKILDFGLAKVAQAGEEKGVAHPVGNEDEPGRRTSPSATPDPWLSRTGVAMGTAGYMSPEQARGEKLDARTDLFSFGLVVYEMATGQRVFQGDTGPLLHDAILHQSPTSARQINPKIPRKLDRIILKALERERDARYASAAAIRADLQGLKRDTERSSRWRQLAAGVIGLLLVISTIFWLFRRRQAPSQAPTAPKLTQLTFNSFENRVTSGAISPNGKYLAYADIDGMHVKLIESGTIQAVPQPEGFNRQNVQWEVGAWFPESDRFLANANASAEEPDLWSSSDTSIWMVSVPGGAPSKLRDQAIAYSVSPDGSLISFGTNKGEAGGRDIWLMTAIGEQAHKLLQADEKSSLCCLQFFRGGQRVSYITFDDSGITLVGRDLRGGSVTTLLPPSETRKIDEFTPWLPDGRLLFAVKESGTGWFPLTSNFWAMRLDPRTGQVIEKPSQLTSQTGSWMTNASVTADGKRLVFLRQAAHGISYLGDLAAGGTRVLKLRHFPLRESSSAVDWTPDSKQLINVSTAEGSYQLHKQPLDQEAETSILTKDYGRNPQVTPDGEWILYQGVGDPGTPWDTRAQPVMRVSIDGGKSNVLFTTRPASTISCARPPSKLCTIAEPTQDRTHVVISALDPMVGRGSELARFAIDPNGDPGWAQLSPDGTRIVATGSPAGLIFILSLRGQPMREIRVKEWSNLIQPTWTSDGKGLYVSADVRGGKVLLHIDLFGNSKVVWEGSGAAAETLATPSPDGRHLLINTWTRTDNMWMMENF